MPSSVDRLKNSAYSSGEQVGQFLYRNGKTMLICALIVVLIIMLIKYVPVFAAAEVDESNASFLSAAAAYKNAFMHRGCKNSAGCGKGCPFTDRSDPRITAEAQVESMRRANEMIQEGLRQSLIQDSDSMDMYNQVESNKALIDGLIEAKRRCATNASSLYNAASLIFEKHGKSKVVDAKTINAKNRVSALESALLFNASVFAASSILTGAYMMHFKIKGLSELDQKQITNYDKKASICHAQVTKILDKFNAMFAITADTTKYGQYVDAVMNEDAKSDDIVASMAMLMNLTTETGEDIKDMASRYELVADTYRMIMSKVESFSNALPAQLSADDMTDLISRGDYGTALIRTALEPEIMQNHKKFANERSSFDSGGGVPSVRDDDNDVVPWVGLFGRPNYRRSDGSSIEKSSQPLKSIPSDVPEDLMRMKVPRLSMV